MQQRVNYRLKLKLKLICRYKHSVSAVQTEKPLVVKTECSNINSDHCGILISVRGNGKKSLSKKKKNMEICFGPPCGLHTCFLSIVV